MKQLTAITSTIKISTEEHSKGGMTLGTQKLENVTSDKAERFPLNSKIGDILLNSFWVKKAFCPGNCYILVSKDTMIEQ